MKSSEQKAAEQAEIDKKVQEYLNKGGDIKKYGKGMSGEEYKTFKDRMSIWH